MLSGSAELFSKEALEKAVERVLHDEAIRKAVSLKKPLKKSAKRLRFPQAACKFPPMKHSGTHSGLPQERVLPHLLPRLFFHPSDMGGGRSFEGFLPPSKLQVGGILVWH